MSEPKSFHIRGYQQKELRNCYRVSKATFRIWLTTVPELGEYKGKAFTPAQVTKIVNHLGYPGHD